MKTLILLLFSCAAFAQLPTSGSLSLKSAAGAGRSISQEVDGNETGNKSLTTLSTTAEFTAPHSMLEFRGWPTTVEPDPPASCLAVNDYPNGPRVEYTPPASGPGVQAYFIVMSENGVPIETFYNGLATSYNYSHASATIGATYTFSVQACNDGGEGGTPDNCSTACNTGSIVYEAIEPPGNITNVSASMSCAGGIDITWTNNAATPTADYTRVEVQSGGEPNPYTFYAIVNYPGASINIPAVELTDNVTYRYRLTPVNGGGDGLPSLTDFIKFCPVPSPPLSISAVKNGGNIDVSWDVGPNADTYRLEVKISSGSYSFLEETALRSYSFLDAFPGQQYTFRVRSENSYGVSDYITSNTVTF